MDGMANGYVRSHGYGVVSVNLISLYRAIIRVINQQSAHTESHNNSNNM